MNYVEIKAQAREMIKENLWTIWKPLTIIYLISFAFSILIELLGNGFTTNIINVIQILVSGVLGVGMSAYTLGFIRGEKVDINYLWKYKDKFVPIFILVLLMTLFVSLWTLLLIVPGIIAALSYSMSYYIMSDDIQSEPLDVLKKSKSLMNGYKTNYFLMNLSFFGWYLLIPFTFGFILIWLIPYNTIANALYYEELKKLNNQ